MVSPFGDTPLITNYLEFMWDWHCPCFWLYFRYSTIYIYDLPYQYPINISGEAALFFHFHRSAASIFLFRADWLQVDELILDGCAVSTRPWITPRHQAPICQNRSKRIGCGANLLEILRVRESQCATTTCFMVPRNNCCITKDRSQTYRAA